MTRKNRFAATVAVVLLLSALGVQPAAAGGGSSTDDPWARLYPLMRGQSDPAGFGAAGFGGTPGEKKK